MFACATLMLLGAIAAKMHYSTYFLFRSRQRKVRSCLAVALSLAAYTLFARHYFPGMIRKGWAHAQSVEVLTDLIVPMLVVIQLVGFALAVRLLANLQRLMVAHTKAPDGREVFDRGSVATRDEQGRIEPVINLP